MALLPNKTWSGIYLKPCQDSEDAVEDDFLLVSSKFYPAGAILQQTLADPTKLQLYVHSAAGVVAPPAAPVGTPALSGGTINDGSYDFLITYVGAAGETLGSARATVVAASTSPNQATISIASPIASTGATKYRVYGGDVGDPVFLLNGAGTNLATPFVISAPMSTAGAAPPSVATLASTTVLASNPPIALVAYPCQTDSAGNITKTDTPSLNTDEFGEASTTKVIACYVLGTFYTQNLLQTGDGSIDANVLNTWHLIKGTTASGKIHVF